MTTLNVRGKVDANGMLNLNVHTHLPPGEVNAVVMVETPGNGDSAHPPYDMTDLAGKLQWQGDALAEQRRLRDEW